MRDEKRGKEKKIRRSNNIEMNILKIVNYRRGVINY